MADLLLAFGETIDRPGRPGADLDVAPSLAAAPRGAATSRPRIAHVIERIVVLS
jgi:hypothetical protein